MADNDNKPELRDPISQEGALTGDEAVQGAAQDPTVEVVKDSVPAQVSPPPAAADDKVNVFETSVQLDHVVTDPSSPEAVQVPDAGRGSLDLPLHAVTGPTVEASLADQAKQQGENSSSPASSDESAPA